jgi:WD40 repeat protein/tetratricopeptide (TPR) repeat protein
MKAQAAAYYVALSRDERFLVAGSGEQAQVWDTATGEPLSPPLKHNGIVHSVAFLPDGHRILTACGNTAQIWDLAAGETAVQLLPHGAAVAHGSLSSDGKTAVTMGQDRVIRLWNTATGEPLWNAWPREGEPHSIEFSADGERIVIAQGEEARVWSVKTGKPLSAAMKHAGGVEHAVFSPDGRMVATAGADHVARVWDAATGQPISPPLRHGGRVGQVRFSSDNLLVATGSEDHTARIWNATSGAPVTSPLQHGGFVGTVRFSPDSRLLLTAGADRTAMIWNAASGAAVSPPLKHLAFARDATFSPDGQFVATSSYDQTARVWRVANGQPVTPPLKHFGLVDGVVFSKDGRYVATISRDHVAQVWESATGEPLTPPLLHGGRVHDAVFDPGGRELITLSGDAMVRRWPLDLSPPSRPVGDLVLQADMLDGHYIDATGGFMPLEPEAFQSAWQRLRSNYPGDFAVSDREVNAWHGRNAAELALRGDWAGVIEHLDVVLNSKFSRPSDWRLRGRAHAELGHWQQAADDLEQAGNRGIGDGELIYQFGLLCMSLGNEEKARNCSERLLSRLACDASPDAADHAARLAGLLARHDTDWKAVLQAAEAAVAAQPKNTDYLATMSLVQGRTERWPDAIKRLESLANFGEFKINPVPALLLAIAHHSLGNRDAAQEWLKKANQLIERHDSEGKPPPPRPWERQLEIEILRREAIGK